MEDSGVRHETRQTALPDELLQALRHEADSGDAELVERFARGMLRRVPPAQLEALDPAGLTETVMRAFDLLRVRRPGERKVTTYNPESGDEAAGTALLVTTDDRPFLLSSITAEILDQEHEIVRAIHPIIGAERDDDGVLVAVQAPREASHRESLVHVDLRARLSGDERAHLEDRIDEVVSDVIAATDDYPAMRRRIAALRDQIREHASARPTMAARVDPEQQPEEVAAFMQWLLDGNFLLIGSRDYTIRETDGELAVQADAGSALGVLAGTTSTYAEPVRLADADEGVRTRHASETLLSVVRSHRASTIDQRVRMLNVWVTRFGRDGERIGERRILGIFTRKAQAERATAIPVLRKKSAQLLDLEDILPETHDERTYTALFEAMPKEELFELSIPDLRSAVSQLAAAEEGREVRSLCHVDELTRTASVIVSVPRDRYDPNLRRRIQELLVDRFNGESVDVDLSLGDRPDAVVRFAVHIPRGPIPTPDLEELEADIRRLARTWLDELEDALAETYGAAEAHRLVLAVGSRLPPAYRENTDIADAVLDVALLEDVDAGDDELRVTLRETTGQPPTRVKILKKGSGIELSTVMPILESLGLTVVEELPFRLVGPGSTMHVHDYGVRPESVPIDIATDGPRIADAIIAAWDGRLEVDSLNRLVVVAGLDWATVALLRAYRRFRRQVGTAYTADYQNDALANNPEAARALVAMFEARFDPDRNATAAEIREASDLALETIEAAERLDEDRILRDFHALVAATLRTNRYRGGEGGTLSLKFDSAQVPGAPRPLPYREIFVYSPSVEGLHLRGAPVARGGIRWSERRDDFRSEVLDLMRAQMLKNALIVPDGAKGGFVVKRPEADGNPAHAYAAFVGALLEITDNVVGQELRGPDRVRRLDGDDPYLVVAADRGTATFSDLANEISKRHGFWLADAFASGGSDGYDHKGLGITARGAWVAVGRHFRELGIDLDADPVTVVGIGDMSGDVFGNAMLLSRSIRLVAAFDHRDIFLDPEPEPDRAWAERKRLFDTPGSSWQDYDREAIAEGGGVWSRSEKAIVLTDEIRQLLRVDAEVLSPPELIRAILRAPVDLLFAGGIGTFVKSSTEAADSIGDRSNAEGRVDATELRCRVVGEGANLAMTQRARVQYARRGGRVNTDFVDNAGGVDISDREVNIKILLGMAAERDLIDEGERTALLRAVTDDVVAACLDDVDLQTWTLYQEVERSPRTMETYETLMGWLEQREALDRDVEALPGPEEMRERAEVGAGLTRPELAVILAATKRDLAAELITAPITGLPTLDPLLAGYFPPVLLERCATVVGEHHLRRELVATELANDLVDRVGITFAHRLARELGIDRVDVATAYWIARQVAEATRYSDTVRRIDRELGAETALMAKQQVDALLETLTRHYARSGDLEDPDATIARDHPAFFDVEAALTSARPRPHATTAQAERLVDAGVEPEEAVLLGGMRDLAVAPHVAQVARRTGRTASGVATAFLRIDGSVGISRVRRLLESARPTDRWQRWHLLGLIDDLRDIHRAASERALLEHADVNEMEAVDRYLGRRDAGLRHASSLLRQVEEEGTDGSHVDALAVVVRTIRTAILGGHDET